MLHMLGRSCGVPRIWVDIVLRISCKRSLWSTARNWSQWGLKSQTKGICNKWTETHSSLPCLHAHAENWPISKECFSNDMWQDISKYLTPSSRILPIYTTFINIGKSAFCPQIVCMCFVYFPQKTATFSPKGIELLVFVIQTLCLMWYKYFIFSHCLPACQSALQPWVSLGLLYNQSPPGGRFLNKIIFNRMRLLAPMPNPHPGGLGCLS
jgi:hypothetical protein